MKSDLGFQRLEREMQAERAHALFRIIDKMRAALDELAAVERSVREHPPGAAPRDLLLQRAQRFDEAAELVWYFVVQRESLRLQTTDETFAQHEVPEPVRVRMGPQRRRSPRR